MCIVYIYVYCIHIYTHMYIPYVYNLPKTKKFGCVGGET